MPLDDAERSVLAETERQLADDDPGLERRLRDGWGARRPRTHATVGATTLLLVFGLCWLALPAQAIVVLLLAGAVLLGTGWRPRDWIPAALRTV
jgi:hypothetical protein